EPQPRVTEYALQLFRMNLRQPHQHHRVVAIVFGEVERLGFALHQYLALAELHPYRERLAVFLHPADEFLAHSKRERAVRSSFLDTRKAERNPSQCLDVAEAPRR